MFSIRCNSRIKSWKNKKRPTKNSKNYTFLNRFNYEGINYRSERLLGKKMEEII